MDWMQALRRKRLLRETEGGIGVGGQTNLSAGLPSIKDQSTITNSPLNSPDASSLRSLRKRPTPRIKEYLAYLDTAPKREDHKLGKLGTVAAAVAGFAEGYGGGGVSGAYNTTRGLLDAPYERAERDYKSKGGRLKEMADLEYTMLSDDQKLEVLLSERDIKERKQLLDEKAEKRQQEYTDAQIENFRSEAKSRGKSIQKNDNGELEVVSLDGTRMSLGKFNESLGEKDTREHNIFSRRYNIEQGGRAALQGNQQSFTRIENEKDRAERERGKLLDFERDANLIRLRKEVGVDSDVNPTQSNAAFQGAMEEILAENPEIQRKLYNVNDGNLELKKNYDPDIYADLLSKVKTRKDEKLNGRKPGQVIVPKEEPPKVVSPEEQLLRQTALQAIKESYPDDPSLLTNEEAIAEAMKQIREKVPETIKTAPPPQPAMPQEPLIRQRPEQSIGDIFLRGNPIRPRQRGGAGASF